MLWEASASRLPRPDHAMPPSEQKTRIFCASSGSECGTPIRILFHRGPRPTSRASKPGEVAVGCTAKAEAVGCARGLRRHAGRLAIMPYLKVEATPWPCLEQAASITARSTRSARNRRSTSSTSSSPPATATSCGGFVGVQERKAAVEARFDNEDARGSRVCGQVLLASKINGLRVSELPVRAAWPGQAGVRPSVQVYRQKVDVAAPRKGVWGA